jgi:hypothetical protein
VTGFALFGVSPTGCDRRPGSWEVKARGRERNEMDHEVMIFFLSFFFVFILPFFVRELLSGRIISDER